MKSLEHGLESLLFRSRWLLAPFYLGLVITILFLLIKFFQQFTNLLPTVLDAEFKHLILQTLVLVDLTLLANLLLIIILAATKTLFPKSTPLAAKTVPSGWAKSISLT